LKVAPKRICLLTILILSPVMSASSRAADTVHIVAFGDSTTATRGNSNSYTQRIAKSLNNVSVTNAGVGGSTTRHAVQRLERDVLKKQPRIVIIQFGINDSAVDVWKNPPATKPRVPIQEYQANLIQIARNCRKIGATPILMSPNPLRWTDRLKQTYGKPPYNPDKADGFNLLLRDYADVVRQIAKQEKVQLVDINAAFEKAGAEKLLLDGMHPNDAGHELITKELLPVLRQIIGKISL